MAKCHDGIGNYIANILTVFSSKYLILCLDLTCLIQFLNHIVQSTCNYKELEKAQMKVGELEKMNLILKDSVEEIDDENTRLKKENESLQNNLKKMKNMEIEYFKVLLEHLWIIKFVFLGYKTNKDISEIETG